MAKLSNPILISILPIPPPPLPHPFPSQFHFALLSFLEQLKSAQSAICNNSLQKIFIFLALQIGICKSFIHEI